MRLWLIAQGTLYLRGRGTEERQSVANLSNEVNDTIVSMECFTMHGEHLFPENVERCNGLAAHYDDYDYGNLMNTTFGLVPTGRSPGTYRLGEVGSKSYRGPRPHALVVRSLW